ncbi:EamA family transporter [Nocardia sp. NPDC049526]|uniref:EamA family transporter n=1 Tax=Nocardia sp. NPDC049526 TaxID=3364316 RepID=UPI0037BA80F7
MKVQPRAARAVPAPILILAAMVSIQLGAGLAKYLFEIIGASTAASVRLAFAGAIALLLWRPSLRVDRAALPGITGLGVAVAGMNLCFYAAIERIPLGMAVALDFLGPLTVAVIASRRPRDLVWTVVAGLGVLMMVKTGGPVSWTGVLFAIAAGAGWGAYIACSEVVGRHTSGHDGLALAMAFGGLLVLPVAFANASPALFDPLVLAALAVVAVLSSLVPHAIELEALRRISAATFGVLMSLEPAVAAAAGLLLLGEDLALVQCAGIGLVIIASAGASGTGSTKAPEPQRYLEPVPI